jgi:hypothetical protein
MDDNARPKNNSLKGKRWFFFIDSLKRSVFGGIYTTLFSKISGVCHAVGCHIHPSRSVEYLSKTSRIPENILLQLEQVEKPGKVLAFQFPPADGSLVAQMAICFCAGLCHFRAKRREFEYGQSEYRKTSKRA